MLYLLSGLWCTFQYQLAAKYVGYVLVENRAVVEFLSVYGGIQVGLALAVFYFSGRPKGSRDAVLFTLFISLGLFAYRVGAMSLLGSDPALLAMACVELVIVILLVYQLLHQLRKERKHERL
jgi:predicted RND superfamily exporter protein